jgi:D-glycero-D-manno-heptose 1,7-bisphosphate phosphatase
MTRRFALLDRDGTINVERDHLDDPDEVKLIPGAAAAIARLRDELGLGIVVVTNQAQIGRGSLTPERLQAINDRLVGLLAAEGATLDAVLHCPHAPEDGCDCRKPRPAMALRAAERFAFDPVRSFVVGDHAGDMGLGRAVGATTILVLTGHGDEERPKADGMADHVATDLGGAVDIIAALLAEGSEEG